MKKYILFILLIGSICSCQKKVDKKVDKKLTSSELMGNYKGKLISKLYFDDTIYSIDTILIEGYIEKAGADNIIEHGLIFGDGDMEKMEFEVKNDFFGGNNCDYYSGFANISCNRTGDQLKTYGEWKMAPQPADKTVRKECSGSYIKVPKL